MISIRRLLYELKKRYSTKLDYYVITDLGLNILTGEHEKTRTKFHIKQAVYLQQKEGFRNPLLSRANPIFPQSGLLDVDNAELLVDGRDFPRGFVPKLDDYTIIEGERLEIKSIHVVDKDQSYYFILKEYKGSKLYEIHDRSIHQKLTLVHIVKPHLLISIRQDLQEDNLIFEDWVITNKASGIELIDEIDFSEGIDVEAILGPLPPPLIIPNIGYISSDSIVLGYGTANLEITTGVSLSISIVLGNSNYFIVKIGTGNISSVSIVSGKSTIISNGTGTVLSVSTVLGYSNYISLGTGSVSSISIVNGVGVIVLRGVGVILSTSTILGSTLNIGIISSTSMVNGIFNETGTISSTSTVLGTNNLTSPYVIFRYR